MDFFEKDLETIIYESTQTQEGRNILMSRGLFVNGHFLRQPDLGQYGKPDLVSIEYQLKNNVITENGKVIKEKDYTITIYELKKNKVDLNTILQAYRYKRGVFEYLKSNKILSSKNRFTIEIVLIGKSIDLSNSFGFLASTLNYQEVKFYTYSYSLQGLIFNEVSYRGWHFSNVNFKYPISKYTVKSIFKNSDYPQFIKSIRNEDTPF